VPTAWSRRDDKDSNRAGRCASKSQRFHEPQALSSRSCSAVAVFIHPTQGFTMTHDETLLDPVAALEPARPALLVSSIQKVTRSRLLTVGLDALLAQVAALLSASQISLVLVCDARGSLVGVITETILVRQLGFGQAGVFTTRAGEVMTKEFTVCAPADPLSKVLAMMHERGLIHVPVVEADNRPVGVLNARDGLRALLVAGNHEEALLRNYVMGVGYQ
jgi:CBS domain-containing protein